MAKVIEFLTNSLRFVGLFITVSGLWQLTGGLRLVVSGRIDERQRSASSMKRGWPMLIIGVILLCGGNWLAKWARME